MFAAQDGSTPNGKLYVDDVFSTYLYTGNGANQTINNGIDLAGKGGMLWTKVRNTATQDAGNVVVDTSRGKNSIIYTNSTAAAGTSTSYFASLDASGFTAGTSRSVNGETYASWTFRKAPKFFDVVTYTGDGVAGRQIAHSLGVAPGMIIVKATSATTSWAVYHTNLGNGSYLLFESAAGAPSFSTWNNTSPTSSVFTLGSDSMVNSNGGVYVAYLFAHDTASDGIIQCGSYTGNGSTTGPSVTLGWEPQYLLIKKSSPGSNNWQIIDSMRGMPVGSADATLQANLTSAESSADYVSPTATGFQVTSTSGEVNTSGEQYIYMAIRRPNKPPTTGTQVYMSSAASGTVNTSFPVDLHIGATRAGASNNHAFHDRLRGGTKEIVSSSTATETTVADLLFDSNTGLRTSFAAGFSNHFFKRAPGFFDVVCYTGDGIAGRSIAHNLGVTPEFAIIKARNYSFGWRVAIANPSWSSFNTQLSGSLNTSNTLSSGTSVLGASTNSSYIQLNQTSDNTSPYTYVAYLFATLPGISKVGSYTGNGTSQTINCGFTTGARFILIKRTDSTGDWYVWDSARGIVAANDPHLSLNTTAAEVTTDDSVDPDASGFIVNQVAATGINVSGGSYIFLAIA